MMKHSRVRCKEIAQQLSEYLEQEVDTASCGEVIEHMKNCPPCVAFLKSLQKTIELTHEAASAPVKAPPISDELRRKLKQSYETFRAKSASRAR